jgi:hypothetical protein
MSKPFNPPLGKGSVMGAFCRSAAATVLATATVLCLALTGNTNTGATVKPLVTASGNHSDTICPFSMVWDGLSCVWP